MSGSITKHLNGYAIGGKIGNCNVHLRPSHGARVRCVDKQDHIVFHVGTNDIPSGKETEDIAKLIVSLVMCAKASTCDVSISNIITRKGNHQHKAQEVNNHMNEMYTNKNINLIGHSNNIKHQHLIKSKAHLTKRGTYILLTRIVQEISNICQRQCVLLSTDREVTGSCNFAGFKSDSKRACTKPNHLKSHCKNNLNRLILPP